MVRRRALVVLVVGALLLAGCSSGSAGGTPSSSPTSRSTMTSSPSSTSRTTTLSPDAPVRVASVEDVATGLDVPWGLVRLPDGSHLVSLRDEARVVHVATDGTVTRVPATGSGGRVPGVHPDGEGGLLGITLAPDDPHTVYAYLTAADDNRVVRMSYTDGRLGDPRVIVDGIPKSGIHNGGRLAFGPDGMLYVTTGDGSDGRNSQDHASLGGKILRVTPDGKPAPGNPDPRSPVWTSGHRNVQGIGWDDQGRMFASEFGQNTWDELNRILPGHDYGWPDVEGTGTSRDVQRGFTNPLAVWHTDEASPSGLAVGDGSVLLAALRGQRLWRLPLHADGTVGKPQALLTEQLGRLRTVELEPDGSLLLLTSNTFRGQPHRGDDRLVRVTLVR
ncbi:MAG TPA: PQQ-dependent sugar dehydrogenase [Actinomycetales bacterium]|nr:PQQ-dependent sugar dehydrogenase [Actinomycetales bacterium]